MTERGSLLRNCVGREVRWSIYIIKTKTVTVSNIAHSQKTDLSFQSESPTSRLLSLRKLPWPLAAKSKPLHII